MLGTSSENPIPSPSPASRGDPLYTRLGEAPNPPRSGNGGSGSRRPSWPRFPATAASSRTPLSCSRTPSMAPDSALDESSARADDVDEDDADDPEGGAPC